MPDGSVLSPLYPVPPSSIDEKIPEPIRRSRPEEIPGLVWTSPDFKAEGHKIVTSFSLNRKNRPGGEHVRCSICSSDHPKFLSGAVIWSPDMNVRLIGHRCAARKDHFGEAVYRDMRRQREQEELDTFALDWLQTYITDLKGLTPTLEQVRLCALSLEEQQGIFFKKAKQLAVICA